MLPPHGAWVTEASRLSVSSPFAGAADALQDYFIILHFVTLSLWAKTIIKLII